MPAWGSVQCFVSECKFQCCAKSRLFPRAISTSPWAADVSINATKLLYRTVNVTAAPQSLITPIAFPITHLVDVSLNATKLLHGRVIDCSFPHPARVSMLLEFIRAMSPILDQPLIVNASTLATSLLKYSLNTTGPFTSRSPHSLAENSSHSQTER